MRTSIIFLLIPILLSGCNLFEKKESPKVPVTKTATGIQEGVLPNSRSVGTGGTQNMNPNTHLSATGNVLNIQ